METWIHLFSTTLSFFCVRLEHMDQNGHR